MNPILVIRSEIVCLVILVFIALYSSLYKLGKDQGSFLRICIFAIGHAAFDLITVLTVNNLDTVPSLVNKLCHIVFYMFALLFSYELFCYTVSLCYTKRTLHMVRHLGFIPILLYLICVPFLPMDYLVGNGTNYSFGAAAITGYGVAMVLFLSSIIVVLINIKKLEKYVAGALIPMLCAAIIGEIVQIIIPELLFTGGAVTILTVGFFFSLENPVAMLRHKVLIDALTGVKSRHSYESDIETIEQEFANGEKFGIVFCDINGLKTVNDTRGHMEGDTYIGCVAQILASSFKSAEAIYRMGGDEFLAVFKGKCINVIAKEAAAVEAACEEESKKHEYAIGVAVGYALSDGDYQSLKDVIRAADYQMYSDKSMIKRNRAFLINNSDKLNISGLTDRIFDAFAGTDSNRFIFVTNMATNVTRWSRSAVEYFGMDSEFVYDCNNLLFQKVHPDDRNMFFDDISAVLSGDQKNHDIEYRIKNSVGLYVSCSSAGTVLKGKNSEPDLFAGTVIVRDAANSIDRLTGLRNNHELASYLNLLLINNTPAALIKLSILNLSRINMLYGYIIGDEVFKQFSEEIRNIIGGSGSVFRSDGSKLVVCLPNTDEQTLSELYENLRISIEQRVHIDTLSPPIQLAAGACMITKNFTGTVSVLNSNLLFAYDKSKYEERGRLVFYEKQFLSACSYDHKDQLLSIHQDAIAGRNGFHLVYQPIVSTKTGKITGAEALIRWRNESFGTVTPNAFIPWLEGDPCFFGLGNWILKTALTEAKTVLSYLPDFVVNINIALTQLEHEGFRNAVLSILEETEFPPNQLCLELTERCRELNNDALKDEIEFFRSHGIRVALDDLGTGFSSFGLLLSLNVDEIKLDHAFVKEIRTKRVNQILTKMLIDASSSMGYATCLEGVEDEELCHYLGDYHATYYQGYYCSVPTEIDEFIAHMKQWNSTETDINKTITGEKYEN